MKTGYFVLPKADIEGYKSRLIAKKLFTVHKDLKGNIKEVKGTSILAAEPKSVLDEEGKEVGTEETINPEFTLSGRVIATLKDGRQISHAVIPKGFKKASEPYLKFAKEVEDYDPLETENQKTLGIEDKFIGYTRKDVLIAFPELKGQEKIGTDEKGNAVMVDKLTLHTWAGQE